MMMRWNSMMLRCYSKESNAYIHYGARGITVCEEWHDFEKFYAFWGDPPFDGASMGRIDNNGNYEPSNCRWENQSQQNGNTRRSRVITWNGKTQTMDQWAKEYDIGMRRLSERLRRGWSMDRALTTHCPLGYEGERNKRLEKNKETWAKNGEAYRLKAQSKKTKISKLSLSLDEINLLCSEKIPWVKELHEAGVSDKQISSFLAIPQKVVVALIVGINSL